MRALPTAVALVRTDASQAMPAEVVAIVIRGCAATMPVQRLCARMGFRMAMRLAQIAVVRADLVTTERVVALRLIVGRAFALGGLVLCLNAVTAL